MAADDSAVEPELHHDFDYFADRYRQSEDPWQFDTAWYERRKYALTMAALPRPFYRRALEPGCANGALSELLTTRCRSLVSFDFVDHAVDRARRRLDGHSGATVLVENFPRFWPIGTGDLVVWSEVAYYLTAGGRLEAERGLRQWLVPGGTLVAVHYTGETDYPATGTATHEWIDGLDFLDRYSHTEDTGFVLDVWQRVEGRKRSTPITNHHDGPGVLLGSTRPIPRPWS